jgi:heptosyltransferase-3
MFRAAPLPSLGKNPRILFVTATRIGDAVLSTGLLAHMVERYPEARFTIVAGPVAAPLFEAVPGLEKLIALKKRRYSRHWLDLYLKVAMRRWDLVVDLRGSAIAWLLRARHRRVGGKGDRSGHRVAVLGRLFGCEPPPAPKLWLSAQHRRRAEALVPSGGPVLVLAPAANWRGKQWRAERFAELAHRLTAPGAMLAGARVAVVAAPHERTQAAPVLAAIPAGRAIDLVGVGDLPTVAAVLGRATLFIGNDSGLMHMAAAMGVPTLGLFGPSPIEHYAPWGLESAVAATPISYEALVTAPSFDHRTTDTLMDSLTVEAVERAAVGLLARLGKEAVDIQP